MARLCMKKATLARNAVRRPDRVGGGPDIDRGCGLCSDERYEYPLLRIFIPFNQYDRQAGRYPSKEGERRPSGHSLKRGLRNLVFAGPVRLVNPERCFSSYLKMCESPAMGHSQRKT